MVSIEEMNGKQNVDIAVLQNEVKEIKNNHLVHLSNDIKEVREKMITGFERQTEIISNLSLSLSTKLAYYAGGLATLVIILGFLLKFID